MELDIDFTKQRNKLPLYTAVVLTFLLFCWSTPLKDEIMDSSCEYIEDLSNFWYNKIGFSTSFVDSASDWLGFYLFKYLLVIYLVLVDNKFFALVQLIGILPKGVISQYLKVIFQDNRPAWSCDNLEIGYCRSSYGLTATHVWEGTVCYLSLIYFFFIHNGFFNRRPRNILVQILRYVGISLCVLCIWLVHQTRLILGAHYLYQDYYGFLCGCIYFYLLYYYFYPWAMDPGRRFEWSKIWRWQIPFFLLLIFLCWTIFIAALSGQTIPDGAISNFLKYCGYQDVTSIKDMFVTFDVSDAIHIFSSWLMLWLLPLKHHLPHGHFYIWGLIGVIFFIASEYMALKYWACNVLDWHPVSFYVIDYYFYAVWIAFFDTIPFAYYVIVLKLFSREYKEKMAI